jgi:hypothetical protein
MAKRPFLGKNPVFSANCAHNQHTSFFSEKYPKLTVSKA